ncbi:unnamed protein product [Rhizopus stolonifer]
MNGADLTQNEFWEQLMRFQTEIAKNDEARTNGETLKDEEIPIPRQLTKLAMDGQSPKGLDAMTQDSKQKNSPNGRKPAYIAKAEAEKTKGNEFFMKKDFHNAKHFYTSAIEINPTVSVYYVNNL